MKIKLAIGSLFIVISYLLFAPRANAQFQNPNYLNTNPDVPQNFHTYTQSVFIEISSAVFCQVVGADPINPSSKCLGVDPKTQKIGFVENGGGLFAVMGNLISMTFQIPVSSTHYAKYLADNFGIAKNTHAQEQEDVSGGIGFNGLKPLLNLWKTFRNIVYVFFVLIFVIIGLGIMFRIKIDPRTVMTIQNQIPKIIISLILVTFSYAIVGFLIDIMYVFMYLIFNVFAPHLSDVNNFNPAKLQGSNPLSAVGFLGGVKMAADAASGLGGIIGSLFDGTTGRIIAGIVGGVLGAGVGSAIPIPGVNLVTGAIGGAILGGFLGSKLFGIIGGIIAFIIIAAALLAALFRLWFALLKAYVFILISTVLAPFWIAGGLIPGSTAVGFGPWMRDIIGNLASFPATLAMFLLGKIFIDAFGANSSPEKFVPPFIGNPGNPNQFGALIGVGIILMTPNVVNMVRSAIKAPEAKFTTAIGQSLQIGAGMAGGPVSAIGGRVWGRDPYTKEPYWLTGQVYKGLSRFSAGLGGVFAKVMHIKL